MTLLKFKQIYKEQRGFAYQIRNEFGIEFNKAAPRKALLAAVNAAIAHYEHKFYLTDEVLDTPTLFCKILSSAYEFDFYGEKGSYGMYWRFNSWYDAEDVYKRLIWLTP